MGHGERLIMAEGSEIEYDPEYGIAIINDTEVTTEEIRDGIRSAVEKQSPELAAIRKWASSSQGANRKGTIFSRDRFVTPDTIFDKFKLAAEAVRSDDIISNVVETTEQLAFKRIAIECDDELEEDIWNQIINEINLSERLREGWREMFTISQCYPAVVFEDRQYKATGSRKQFGKLSVPAGITYLDPLKVIPVGNFMFGQEDLIYLADRSEALDFNKLLADSNSSDLVVNQLISGYYPIENDNKRTERQLIADVTGVDDLTGRTFLLNPRNVWRITATRPSYRRFADVRMESVFELLDLKHLLREMDRATILGSTNAIILVKKGSDDRPAQAAELQQVAAEVKTTSRIPIIVSDHRLEIEIITPKVDYLSTEKYNGLDSRITSRLYQMLNTGNYASGTGSDDSIKLMRVVASSMEARRDQIRDSFMDKLFKEVWRKNPKLKSEPKMQFYPRRIALDFDPNIAQFLMDLRGMGEISRTTVLAELDLIQTDEAIKRQREANKFDDIFTPIHVPFDTKPEGRQGGGNRNGGGNNPDSNRANPPDAKAKPDSKKNNG
jgi:hypothetical protein